MARIEMLPNGDIDQVVDLGWWPDAAIPVVGDQIRDWGTGSLHVVNVREFCVESYEGTGVNMEVTVTLRTTETQK